MAFATAQGIKPSRFWKANTRFAAKSRSRNKGLNQRLNHHKQRVQHEPAVSAMLDRLLHHGHLLKCGPRSWRAKAGPTNPNCRPIAGKAVLAPYSRGPVGMWN